MLIGAIIKGKSPASPVVLFLLITITITLDRNDGILDPLHDRIFSITSTSILPALESLPIAVMMAEFLHTANSK